MKIIDSHLHFCPGYPHFDEIAIEAGHINNEEHLRECFQKYNIVGGIVMGNRGVHPDNHTYPDFLRYCVGVEARKLTPEKIQKTCDLVEENLKRNTCVGIKLYPGYDSIYVTDERFEPIYDLAKAYKKPVAIHTGQTAGSKAFIKYSHPLTLDEAAVRHPDVQFVMCHFGNPWLMDAAAVVEKNENVAADLSGLLEGKFDIPEFLEEQSGYISTLKTWLAYIRDYDKLMFGTDWPLANYEDYIEITKRLIPEKYWEMSPFELSGGQKRRAAIAGVIAMNPKVLILDEPTAGLDPKGRDELFDLIRELHENMKMTVLLVSHSMEDVANYVDRIIVLNHGSLMLDGTPAEVFSHVEELERVSLAVPQVTYLMKDLKKAGLDVNTSVTTIEEAKKEIMKLC